MIVMVLTRSVWTLQPQQSGAQLGQVEQRGEQTQIAASSNIKILNRMTQKEKNRRNGQIAEITQEIGGLSKALKVTPQ